MTVRVLQGPSPHYVVAVWRPEYDTGIKFDLICAACRRSFGYFAMDETKPRMLSMVSVVNELHRRVNDAQARDGDAGPCGGASKERVA